METDKGMHKTSTGKIFRLTDLDGNLLEYSACKGIFTRPYIAALEVGQILRSSSNGMMLERIK